MVNHRHSSAFFAAADDDEIAVDDDDLNDCWWMTMRSISTFVCIEIVQSHEIPWQMDYYQFSTL